MNLTVSKLLLLVSVGVVVLGCRIARLGVDTDYGCGSTSKNVFTANEFPADFVGSTRLTLGIWFKINAPADDSFPNQFILFMLTPDGTIDEPSVSFASSSPYVDVYHTFHSEPSGPIELLAPGQWYFGIESCDISNINEI